jgi:hypothetical protein
MAILLIPAVVLQEDYTTKKAYAQSLVIFVVHPVNAKKARKYPGLFSIYYCYVLDVVVHEELVRMRP